MDKFYDQIKNCTTIADFGGGVNGSWNYAKFFPETCIDVYDLNKDTKPQRSPNIKYQRADVTKLYRNGSLTEKYDLIFCEHVYEHVENPAALTYSINKSLRPNGLLHMSLPDATNFIDIFYRQLFPKSGGHIQKFTKDSIIELLTGFGFELIDLYPMEETWGWYERSYPLIRDLLDKHEMTDDEFQLIADTFKKELTLDKGYFYGWCFLFKKIGDADGFASDDEGVVVELIDVIPRTIDSKSGCNVQPNGMSAIAVTCANANSTTLILWDDFELDTFYSNPEYLTAFVPPECITEGSHEIRLLDYSCNLLTAPALINIL